MTFTVLLERRAERELLALPSQVVRRIDNRLRSLAEAPTPRGAIKLQGRETEGWRIRVGDYRILYTIDEAVRVVRVYRIRHKPEAYR